jgi:hypothetical protein
MVQHYGVSQLHSFGWALGVVTSQAMAESQLHSFGWPLNVVTGQAMA